MFTTIPTNCKKSFFLFIYFHFLYYITVVDVIIGIVICTDSIEYNLNIICTYFKITLTLYNLMSKNLLMRYLKCLYFT